MSRYAGSLLLGTALMVGTVVWAASVSPSAGGAAVAPCRTAAHVLAAADRSRNGISMVCSEQVRRRNVARSPAG